MPAISVTTDISGQTVIASGQFNNPTSYDAFGRFRTSQPFTLFDNMHTFSKGAKFIDCSNNTTGTATFNSTDSSIDLAVTNQVGSMIIRESRIITPYQPGKSLLILNTFAFNDTSGNNLIQRVGYYTTLGQTQYDAANKYSPQNGIYLEANGNTIYMNKANNGSVIKIHQSTWNGYKFDGTAPYFVTLDLTKAQIYWIDIEWLGVGSVRTGFIINGAYIIAHTFHHANIESSTYMQTACLPPRFEIINTTSGSGGSMKQICTSVMSEGGYDAFTEVIHSGTDEYLRHRTSGESRTFFPLLSIRLKSNRLGAIVIPCQLSIITGSSDNIVFKILLNADITGASWVSSSDAASVEYDISGTAFSGGTQLNAAYISQNTTINLVSRNDFNLQLGKSFTTNPYTYKSDTITVAVCLAAVSQSAFDVGGLIGWYDVLK